MRRTLFQQEYNAQVKQACESHDVREQTEKDRKRKLAENLATIQKDQILAKEFQ